MKSWKLSLLVNIIIYVLPLRAELITGTVYCKEKRCPVSGVSVSVGFSTPTKTDDKGYFKLDIDRKKLDEIKSDSLVSKKIIINNEKTIVTWNKRLCQINLSDPNPVRSIRIYTLNGKLIYRNTKINSSNTHKIPPLEDAICIFRITYDNGKVYSDKLNTTNTIVKLNYDFKDKTEDIIAVEQKDRLLFRHDDFYPLDIELSDISEKFVVKLKPDRRSHIFDTDLIHSYSFNISLEDSLKMEHEALQENYVPAMFSFNDTAMGLVGIRYKGSDYSLSNCFCDDSMANCTNENSNRHNIKNCSKISIKIKFNKYESGKKFYEMKTLNLHAMASDPTKMHEMIGYKMFRNMNINAPRTAYSTVYINGVFQGLFLNVEAVDDRFTKSRWPESGKGNLYKSVWIRSDDEKYYLNGLETNNDLDDKPNVNRIVNTYKVVSASNETNFIYNLSPFIDFNYMMRFLAVDRAVKNWDGVTTWYGTEQSSKNHNYFFYQDGDDSAGKLWLIPWDLDNSFQKKDRIIEQSNVPQWNEIVECMEYPISEGSVIPACCDKFTRLLALTCNRKFVNAGKELLNTYFTEENVVGQIEKYASLIDPIVIKDPYIHYQKWVSQVKEFKKYIPDMISQFDIYVYDRHLTPIDSSDYLVPFNGSGYLLTNRTNNFEFAPGSAQFAITWSSENSWRELSHNFTDPLSGKADIKFSFNHQPIADTISHSEYAGFKLLFNKPFDLRKLKQVNFCIKSNNRRAVNVYLTSKESMSAVYGWKLNTTTNSKVASLNISEIEYLFQTERQDPDTLDNFLRSVDGIAFVPKPKFNTDGEIMGKSDSGYIQLDNIQFVFKPR